MDGYETTRQIRQWELESCNECFAPNASKPSSWRHGNGCQHHRIPIIAVTADVMKGTHDLCFEAGMDDYISKVGFSVEHAAQKYLVFFKLQTFIIDLQPHICKRQVDIRGKSLEFLLHFHNQQLYMQPSYDNWNCNNMLLLTT
jgi:CheY-like chemotaxis protein